MSNEVLFYDDRVELMTGMFPAHVIKVGTGKPVKSGSIPHNPEFRIAPEAASWEYEVDGEKVTGESMVGQVIRHDGIWLNVNPKSVNDNWRFSTVANAMGMEFATKQVKNAQGKLIDAQVLTELDDSILGNPVLIQIEKRCNKADLDKPEDQRVYYHRATIVQKWGEGKKLDLLAEMYGDDLTDDVEEEY